MAAPSNSALDFSTRALRLIGVCDPAETPSAEDAQTAFDVLNDMVDNWALQRQTIHTIARNVFPLTSGVSSYSLGAGGDWDIDRPAWIEGVSILLDANLPMEIPIGRPLNIQQYQNITQKASTSTFPDRIYWDRSWTAGLSRVYVYPVPTQGSPSILPLEQLLVDTLHAPGPSPYGFSLRIATSTLTDRIGAAITVLTSGTVSAATLRLFRNGTPAGSVWLTLQTGNIGPTGTVLATSQAVDVTTIGSVVGITGVDDVPPTTFTFPPTVIPVGLMYLVLNGDYVRSDVNNILWGGTGVLTVPPVPPDAFSYNGTTVSVIADLNFAYIIPAATVPTAPAIVLYTPSALAQFTDQSTQYTFPPGYAKAIRYNLAVELAAEFGVEPSKTVSRQALLSLADVKRANFAPLEARFDAALVGRSGRYNIYTDT